MNEKYLADIREYGKRFFDKKFIESGYIALRDGDGIVITASDANLENVQESEAVFVNDKNIDSFDGNFRAAAVILFCAIRQDKTAEAAAIVDSDSILKFSSKRKPLAPILDEVAQLLGISVKCAAKNVAAEIVTSLSGCRNACFMPDAGAVIKARSLEEVYEATAVLDKACYAMILAENGGVEVGRLNACNALIEQVVFKMKTSKKFNGAQESVVSATKTDADKAVSEQSVEGQNKDNAEQDSAQNTENSVNTTASNADNAGNSENTAIGNEDVDVLGDAKEFALFKDDAGEETALIMHPFYGSILSAYGKPMPVPQSYRDTLGEEIPCAPSAMACCTKKSVKNVCAVIGEAPACFIAQHGVVVRGKNRDEALNVCRTLEEACKEYLENK